MVSRLIAVPERGRRTRRLLAGLIVSLAALALPAAALADPCSSSSTANFWVGPNHSSSNPGSGSWWTAADWSQGVVPNRAYSTSPVDSFACITYPGTYTVTLAPDPVQNDGTTNDASGVVDGIDVGSGSSGTQTLDMIGESGATNSNGTNNLTDIYVYGDGSASTSTIASNGVVELDATDIDESEGPGGSPGGSVQWQDSGVYADALDNYGKLVLTQNNSGGSTYGDQLEMPVLNNEAGGSIEVTAGTAGAIPIPGGNSYETINNAGAIQVDASGSLLMNSNDGNLSTVFNDSGTFANLGSTNLTLGVDWTQDATGLTGNIINAEGATVDDLTTPGGGSASGSGFDFDYVNGYNGSGTGALEGTVPAGQTIEMSSDPYPGNENLYLVGNVINDGTFDMDAPADSAGNPEVDQDSYNNGTFTNNGTMNLSDESGGYKNLWRAPLTNAGTGVINDRSGNIYFDNGDDVTNAGTLVIDPGADFNWQNGTFTNSGKLSPEIGSASSFGQFKLNGGTLAAGGTLAPLLVGGYTPSSGQEFDVIPQSGGTISGGFAGANSFGVDASKANATSGSAYIAAVYGGAASGSGGSAGSSGSGESASLGSVAGKGTAITAALRCAGAASCGAYTLKATVTEHLVNGKLKAVTARAKTGKRKTIVVTVAQVHGSIAASAATKVTLRLNATGQRLLKRYHHLNVRVTLTSDGKTSSRVVTLTQVRADKKHG
jgi:hypothetical protein